MTKRSSGSSSPQPADPAALAVPLPGALGNPLPGAASPVQGMLCIDIPTLAPHADGLIPPGSLLDLPPGYEHSEVMPPGFLGFVFAFPDNVVVRTIARKVYIVGGFTVSHSMAPLPAPADLISVKDRSQPSSYDCPAWLRDCCSGWWFCGFSSPG